MALAEDQRARLRRARFRALVVDVWGLELPPSEPSSAPGDGLVAADLGDRCVVLVDELRRRRLSAPLLWARRPRVERLDVLVVADPEHLAGVLARQVGRFAFEATVHEVRGERTRQVPPTPAPAPVPPPPGAETSVALLESAGLEVVVESGVIRGELQGLEVARVVADDGEPRLEVGVGSFDRTTSAMLHADRPTAEALRLAVAEVARHRRPGGPPHPVRDLRPERWLRARLVADPGRVGARHLEPVASTLPSEQLRDLDVAAAVGTDAAGDPLVVAAMSGTDVDGPARAADVAAELEPGARLVLACIGPLAPPLAALAGRLRQPPQVVELDPPWARWDDPDGR